MSPVTYTTVLRRSWQIIFLGVALIACVFVMGTIIYLRGRFLMEEQLKLRLRSAAAAAAMQFDGAVLEAIDDRNDVGTSVYQQVASRLKALSDQVPNVRFGYIMRKTSDPHTLQFVVDGDSLRNLQELDRNRNGMVDSDEQPSYPGDTYDVTNVPVLRDEAFLHPAVDPKVTSDQWGSTISGYAPIQRWDNGRTVAMLGLDMIADDYYMLSRSIFSPVAFLLTLVAGLFIAVYLIYFTLRRRVIEWRRLDEERNGLMLLASHQLGTPLTIFKWSLETLRDRAPGESMEDALVQHCAYLEDGVTRMETVLTGLKDAVQIEAGKLIFKLEWGNLNQVIEEVAREAEVRFRREEQTVALDLEPGLRLQMDTKLTAGVLRELIENAMSYSPPRRTVTVTAKREGKFVRITVTDQGWGIPRQDLPRMFQKFVRGSNATKYKADGTGLGLYIARGVVETAGGTMGIESEEGKGTRVSFTIPVAR